ncbi:dTDP-4-dehydrorhamnose reductase family protein [Trinickia dinghuensis]|uniref:dTDP-4-dehydrorhamnose reductase n=1 Tax=Trinickia dinghuensis TaxID=2291023 RepID=A0A3D8JSL5_9BURK|nr:SDR family oxidoreductase [Trinickia dinghuensis]RDU96047.1 SDR family NAD(P)-dependent oxidoreductase [Trinickia dinghuensis]
MNVLVLGASGMLGNAVFRYFSGDADYRTYGTVRQHAALRHFEPRLHRHLLCGVDVLNPDWLARAFESAKPDVVVNCVGLIKQLETANDPLEALPINALLPHRVARMASLVGARMIHVSTDCVFSGRQGNYLESDLPDATDLYGRSKLLGEVDYPHAITLRTSIIGHEFGRTTALVDWFLSQTQSVKGFRKAVFSGVPTVELARVMKDFVLPHPELRGLYHVAAKPIAKFDLLTLVAREYGKTIEIVADDALAIDRSLNATRFHEATGYSAPEWHALIDTMHQFK